MNLLKDIMYSNRLFFLFVLLECITGLCLNGFLSIPLSAHHPVWLNIFFVNYSFMGDGIFAIGLAATCFFYFKKKQTAIVILFSFLFSEALVQLMKNLLSNAGSRLYFEKTQYLFFTDEAGLANFHSFPSGHTAVAFAIATALIVSSKNKKWNIPLFIAASLIGISRMYLAQHSMAELVAGTFSGVVCAILVFYLATNTHSFVQWFKKIHRVQTGNSESPAGMHSA